ncbi:MAG: hypothetical protein H7249_19570 [Chitinophagaceae bacterium]|nr:hypothetical protein [Oligoflexus sp.]
MRLIAIFLLLTACQTAPQPSTTETKALTTAKPTMKQDVYTAHFRDLPLVASLSKLPWASDGWSSARGGASFRWQLALNEDSEEVEDLAPFIQYPIGSTVDINKLSPAEKLDLYLGNKDWAFTKKERHRTLEQTNADGSKRSTIPEWEGMMHAWSEASIQFDPVGPVTLKSKDGKTVTFEAQDMYSLLSLFVHEQAPKPEVLAALCNPADMQELAAGAGPYSFENSKQALRRRHCTPIDAAKFHLVLANQIGKLNEGFIIDRDHQGEIMNNPVVAYETRIIEDATAKKLAEDQPRTLHLRTVLFLTAETTAAALDTSNDDYPYDSESYDYEIDLDGKGNVVKGRWLSANNAEANAAIPDFMWKASPVWLNGPVKSIYDQARQSYVAHKAKQLRPLEDMPVDERQSLNSYFNESHAKIR